MKKLKRNPSDSTLRNTRAANKRLAALEQRVSKLEKLFGRSAKGSRKLRLAV